MATVIGNHPVPVGTHLATCGQCPNAWRVLNAAGRISPGFRWTELNRTDTPADVLEAEGVRFNAGTADPGARLPLEVLRHLVDS
ncbi:hypothetical protein [Streptomyces subrutilus]|uniref:hypothetical protein n=1 Tax=Streptomyces subrutilus TaxID=36818 RepID=UPI0033E3EDC5